MKNLKVSGTLEALAPIAHFVLEAANFAELDTKAANHLRLAVDEIATNIVVYGYQQSGLSGDIELTAVIDEQRLVLILEDTAREFNPLQKPPPDLTLPLEQRPIGGLGILLAIKSVDKFEYERVENRNRNIFMVNCPRPI